MGCCGSKGRRAPRRRSRRLKPKTAKEVKAQMVDYRAHILMCRPKYFGINYSINPWMNVENGADHKKAVEQWNSLESKLKELGCKISHVPPVEGLPDMVFTANAGYIMRGQSKTIVLANFLHDERTGEEDHFEKWFQDNDYKVIKVSKSFEGAGDALYLGREDFKGGEALFIAYGFRSDQSIKKALLNTGEPSIHQVHLCDPRFYHLDTCFCPLQDHDYMIYEGAFTCSQLIRMYCDAYGRQITVPEEEAVKFACNAVCVGRDVVLPSGCPETMQKLEDFGYTPHSVEMSEFMLSGGACKCLTLALS